MGVCTKLFIDSRHSIENVKAVIERVFETKVETLYTHDDNFVQLSFHLQNDQKRLLSLLTSCEQNGFHGTLLSLGSSGRAIEVMEAIADVFGGFLQEVDYDDVWKGVTGKLSQQDGLPFWINRAIVEGVDHKDVLALGRFIEETKKLWQK